MEYTEGECGCYVKAVLTRTNQVEIIYCPKHKSAPEMYEALKLWHKHQQGTRGHFCSECADAMQTALALAEGKGG